jgi:transposase
MKKSTTKLNNYQGKRVFIGMDVHKKHYSLSCIFEGELVKKATVKASPEKLVEFLKKYFSEAKIRSAYEAGFCGFFLHRYLERNGIENRVVHPASIEVSSRDRVKTDKRDSLKIATQLSAGRLTGIHVPSEAREGKRSVTRLRETVMTNRKRIGNQLKSYLFTLGLIEGDDDKKLSKKWLKKILAYEYSKEEKYCVEYYTNAWLEFDKKLDEIDKHLDVQAKEDAGLELIYRSVPGIGKLHARQLCNELGDMKQFKNEKRIYSFSGLTPSEHSSGEHKRQGHITRQGRSVLRKILTQAAWVAIKRDSSLKVAFERIAKNAGKKRAIIGIARRLIGRIRTCCMNGCLYQMPSAT